VHLGFFNSKNGLLINKPTAIINSAFPSSKKKNIPFLTKITIIILIMRKVPIAYLLPVILLPLAGNAFTHSAASAQEEAPAPPPYVMLLQAESLFGYYNLAGEDQSDFSALHDWLASMSWRLNETDRLIAAYNGSFQKTRMFVSQEEGSRESNKLMTNNFTLAWLKALDERTKIRPTFFYDVIFVKETNDENLGSGLYDYEDLGGGLEYTLELEPAEFGSRSVYTGFNMFKRQYPHYSSLLSAFDPNNDLEVNEKDFRGYKIDGGTKAQITEGLSGQIDLTALWKDFTDKRTIDQNGVRQEQNRDDFYYEVSGTLKYALTDRIWLDFSANLSQNLSDLDFYDTRNTASLADDRFVDDYYDYYSYAFSPAVSIVLDKNEKTKKSTLLKTGYSFEVDYYPGRNALDEFNEYKNEEQRDKLSTVFTRLEVPISKQITWVSFAKYEKQTSNQKYEENYTYNYELWSVLSGIKFEY